MIQLNFTDPATLRRLADLPGYGWAEALVRRIDPLWKVTADAPIEFRVIVERGSEGCPDCDGRCCGETGDYERATIAVYAFDEESAFHEAEITQSDKTGFRDWIAKSARPIVCSARVPDEYLKLFEVSQ